MESIFCHDCGQKVISGKFCGHCGSETKSIDKDPKLSLTKKDSDRDRESNPVTGEVNLNLILLLNEAKNVANRMIWSGIGWIIAGLVITGITYAMADPGDTYYVFWGLSIYGAYGLIKGIYYKVAPHKLIEEHLANVNTKEDNEKA